MVDPTGEADSSALRLDFDRRLMLQFRGSTITSDAGLLAYRELDDALHLTDTAADRLADARTGKNGRHRLAGLLRQSVFGRLAGYEDVNDAERLCRDPAMRWVVGDQAISRLKEAHVVEISHEIKIKAIPDHIFAALTKVDELKAWHSSHVSGQAQPGGILHIEGSGKPGFDWKVTEISPPKRVSWLCTAGPGDSVGTRVLFELSPADQGRILLVCTHAGWPGTHGNYRKCNTLWGVLLHHLKQYVETGKAAPAFP